MTMRPVEELLLHEDLEGAPCASDDGDSPEENGKGDEAIHMAGLIRTSKGQQHDVLQLIKDGVIRLGEFELPDNVVTRAFRKEPILTLGHPHCLDCDWERLWRVALSERGSQEAAGSWNTSVGLEAHVVSIRDAAAPGTQGLLQPLLKRYQARGCPVSVFGLPAVQAIIDIKWNTWAARFLVYEMLNYALWLGLFVSFSLLFEDEDPLLALHELWLNPSGLATVSCSVLALLAMLPFLYMEVCTIAAYGGGWLSVWNAMDMASYLLQALITVLHILRFGLASDGFSLLLAAQHLLLWSKVHYFARVFNPAKNLLVETISIVFHDMKRFLLFMALTMMGFAFAFFSLFRQDQDDQPDFMSLWHSFTTMFSYLLAMFDLNVLYNSTNPAAAIILFVVYEYVMNIMLLNIMIAIMASSFSRATQDEGLRLLCSKAQIIDELESTLPAWLARASWYPPFVHILKVRPGGAFDISLSSVWSSMGLLEDNVTRECQVTREKLNQLQVDLQSANAGLDDMVHMLASTVAAGFEGRPSPAHQPGGSRRHFEASGDDALQRQLLPRSSGAGDFLPLMPSVPEEGSGRGSPANGHTDSPSGRRLVEPSGPASPSPPPGLAWGSGGPSSWRVLLKTVSVPVTTVEATDSNSTPLLSLRSTSSLREDK